MTDKRHASIVKQHTLNIHNAASSQHAEHRITAWVKWYVHGCACTTLHVMRARCFKPVEIHRACTPFKSACVNASTCRHDEQTRSPLYLSIVAYLRTPLLLQASSQGTVSAVVYAAAGRWAQHRWSGAVVTVQRV